MAEIKMDISEYEALKENKRLLEQSLKDLKEANEKVELLNREKVKALEEAKMKVVRITREERTDHILTVREDAFRHGLAELGNILGIPELWRREYPYEAMAQRLSKVLFRVTTSVSVPKEEVTVHGLDEIKKELRKDLRKELGEEITRKLEEAEKYREEKSELLLKFSSMVDEVEELKKDNSMLSTNLTELSKKELISNLGEQLVGDIEKALRRKNFFNSKQVLRDISKLINEYLEREKFVEYKGGHK